MSSKVLVAYASKYGSTKEVAEKIQEHLQAEDIEVDLSEAKNVDSVDGFSAIIIGAALYMGRLHGDVKNFLKTHIQNEVQLPVYVFALGPVKEPRNEEEWSNSQGELDKEIESMDWLKPEDVKLVGGKFDPDSMGRLLRLFAGSEPASDIRDWKLIESWTKAIADKLK